MVIQHNLPAMNAKRHNEFNLANVKKSGEKLASGFRINSAADDAAGLAVSEKMRSQIRGMKQAVRNSQDAINLVQTFEGALQESHSILQRCKALAAESANGNYSETDRATLQLEYDQLMQELDHISETDFNGVYMINDNSDIEYEETTVKVPFEQLTTDPVFDADGNPVLDRESYRINAEYKSGSPFGSDGMFAPQYILNGNVVKTEFGNGSTDFLKITLNGTFTDEEGQQLPMQVRLRSPDNDVSRTQYSETNDNGEVTAYISEKIVSANNENGENVKIKLIQRAVPNIEYLTNGAGQNILDRSGNPIPINLMWDISYEISLADDSAPGFDLGSVDLNAFSDTVLNQDQYERYYTSDNANGGPIQSEQLYIKPLAVDSFSCYYYDLTDETFNGVSNKINVDTGDNGPDKVKLGLYRNFDNLSRLSTIEEGDDLSYTLYWENRTPVNGVITFNAGSRGMANSNGDQNISPKLETGYYDMIITNAVTIYHDVNIVVQAGARTKDSVNFTFEYDFDSAKGIRADLNCSAGGLGMDKLKVSDQKTANLAIDGIDEAINKVSMVRANFGATQNRLEHKISNLVNTNENLTEAESAIRDADMASEFLEYSKAQLISNAAQSILAQATQSPQSVLSLLS